MIKLRVFPGAKVRGYPTDGAKPFASYTLADALSREYATDAHAVGYLATDDEHGRHRLTIAALPLGARPVMVVQLVDVDCAAAHKVGGEVAHGVRVGRVLPREGVCERVGREGLRVGCGVAPHLGGGEHTQGDHGPLRARR